MKLTHVESLTKRSRSDLLVLPFIQKGDKPLLASSLSSLKKWGETPISLGDFKGNQGEVFMIYPEKEKEKRIVLLGLGKLTKLTIEGLRRAYAQLVRFCHEHEFKKINLLFPDLKKQSVESQIKGISEGLLLSNYVFDKLKGDQAKKKTLLQSCAFVALKPRYKHDLKKAMTICAGVNLARDLVNDNADTVNAAKLSEIALDFEKEFKKVSTVIFDKKRLQKEKLNLMLAVNQGAATDPALIMVHYKGNSNDKKSTVLVGKGVTYDTGGI